MHSHYFDKELTEKDRDALAWLRPAAEIDLHKLRRQNALQQLSPQEASDKGITRYEPKPLGESDA